MANDDDWVSQGPDDELARRPTVPAVLEVAPGSFKPVDECSADELAADSQSRLLQARILMDKAGRFPSAEGDSLLVQAKARMDEAVRLLDMAEQRRRSEDADYS